MIFYRTFFYFLHLHISVTFQSKIYSAKNRMAIEEGASMGENGGQWKFPTKSLIQLEFHYFEM